MKLRIGPRTVVDEGNSRFKLVKNKLYLKNKIHEIYHLWEDGKKFKIVHPKYLKEAQIKLNSKREVVV